MSKPEKKKQDTNEPQEKVLTRYDLKMQKRQEQKKKDERDRKITAGIGIALLAALVCLLASFPIRNWLTVHGTYIVAAGENVSRVEFDYHYNLVLNNYLNSEEGLYLSYFGIDLSGDLSQQMYSDTLTWQDYFEELAVDNLIRNKALLREMKAAGFQYDTDEDYKAYEESMRQAASQAGMTLNAYIQALFGPYATMFRIESYVREGLATSAYFDFAAESREPSDQEIQAYYENDRDSYDSVDYRFIIVDAELPTEPTELADPAEEDTDDSGDTVYQPSDAEIDAAMALAKAEAELQRANISKDGELNENMRQSGVTYLLRDWLFDEARKAGDTTVIEDSSSHRYYVLEFVDRYLDQTPSVDARIIMTERDNGQAVLDEWLAGEATEESFAALVDRYTADGLSAPDGGLYEGLVSSGMPAEMTEWIYDSGRMKGETAVISPENDDVTYVIYYIGTNDPQWKLDIYSVLLQETMTEYMDSIIEGLEVEDPHNHLHYLEVQAQEETQTADDFGEEDGEPADDSDPDGSSEE